MEVFHRIWADVLRKPDFKTAIDNLHFPYKYSDDIVGKRVFFEISENHPLWPQIRELAERYDVFSPMDVRVKYSNADIASAEWLSMGATRHTGYPQPEDEYQYQVYDPNDYLRPMRDPPDSGSALQIEVSANRTRQLPAVELGLR